MKNRFHVLLILFNILSSQSYSDYIGFGLQTSNDPAAQDDFTVLQSFNEDVYLENTINSSKYLVGPGDEFAFNMVSADGVITIPLKVSPIGDVLIPAVGVISVDKLTLEVAFNHIRTECLEKYENATIHLTLVNIRKFKILVRGTIKNAGLFIVTPVDRVSDIFSQVTGMGLLSTRNIKLHRNNMVKNIDLIKYNMTGLDDLNPQVQQDDVIEFTLKDEEVGLFGGVKISGKYEFVNDESIFDLIQLAGGPTINADLSRIEITRFNNDLDKQIIEIAGVTEAKSEMVHPEDHILIRQKKDYKRQDLVTIVGEVKYPGEYSIVPGESTVRELIERCGGFTTRADSEKIILDNEYIRQIKDIELERISLIPHEDRSDAEKSYIKARMRTSKGELKSSSISFTEDIMDFSLERDDILIIPALASYVEILGAVLHPGRYPIIDHLSFHDYIELAGGKTKTATRDKYIIKGTTGQRLPFSDNLSIENGDIIFVAEKLEYNKWERFKEFMAVGGQMAAIVIVIQNALGN